MIAGRSSGIASAIRTASEARGQMERAAREIATGQRVSSAKDDGAAWSRAAALKSQKTVNEARTFSLARFDSALSATATQTEVALKISDALRGLLIAARSAAPGSPARAAMQTEWDQTIGWMPASAEFNAGWDGLHGHGWQANGVAGSPLAPTDPMFADVILPVAHVINNGWFASTDFGGPPLIGFNIATATNAQLDAATTTNTNLADHVRTTWGIFTPNAQNWIDRTRDYTQKDTDRLDAAIGSLTDADMGKASTRLRQSETRQQLALQTVRQALDAYGSYAGGLLGNVQRTQRAIA